MPEPPAPLAFSPLISVIMPVWREANLNPRLQALFQQGYPDLELIVVDGDPDGGSITDIKPHPRIQTLISPRKGRGHQLTAGAQQATGEILLFLHADTRLPPRALHTLAQLLREHPELAGGAFDLGIDAPEPIYRILETVSSWRSRLTRLPYGDQALFIRRSAYDAIGGCPEIPLMEDVGMGQRLKQQQLSLGFIPERVGTSARRWQTEGILKCTLRNWTLLSLYIMGVKPERLREWYK